MIEDVHVDDGAEVVYVADKNVFLAASDQGIEDAAIGKGIEDISVSGRVPGLDWGGVSAGDGEKRVLDDPGEAGLVEGEDVDVVSLIFLDDPLGVVLGVEGVHENKWDLATIRTIEILDTILARRN